MNGNQLVAMLDAALAHLADSRDELRDLDAALGDGDLGITVSKGCAAVRAKLADLTDPAPAAVLRTAAMAFASANPSTFAALIGGALMAGARAVGDTGDMSLAQVRPLAHAALDSIMAKGKSQPGDKTVLDALAPSIEALDAAADTGADGRHVLAAMTARARDGVWSTAALRSRKGRAAWLGERSLNHPDPGATAYLRFLEAIDATWNAVPDTGTDR